MKIVTQLAELQHHPNNNWIAEDDLDTSEMFKICEGVSEDINLCAFLSAPESIDKSSGKAYIGTICKSGGGWRTSITEKQYNIAQTAGVSCLISQQCFNKIK